MSIEQPDLIELEDKSDRDLLVIVVTKINTMEGRILPSIDEHLEKINGTVKGHGNRLTAIETKCHETCKTVFARLLKGNPQIERRRNGDTGLPPKKYVAIGITFIVIIGSLGYAVGRIMAWW